MNLYLDEGTNVQIIIGHAPSPTLIDLWAEAPVKPGGRSLLGAALKITGVCVLVIGSFWVGEQRGQPTYDDSAYPAPVSSAQAIPSQTAAPSPTLVPPQVPPAFAAQLNQPPKIQPAPGQGTGTDTGNQNAFGLSN